MVYMLGFVLGCKSLSDILCACWTGGVICRNLSGLNLDGEISPAIGGLKNLLSMYINLHPLLSLVSCYSLFICFACICNGTADKCYVNLSSDFSRNQLSGQIPDEIGDCSPLKSLYVSFDVALWPWYSWLLDHSFYGSFLVQYHDLL